MLKYILPIQMVAVLLCAPGVSANPADYTATFDAAVATTCASPDTRTLRLPVGNFLFLSPPAPIPCALNLIGEGTAVTRLVRGYSGGTYPTFLVFAGGQDEYGGGSLRELTLDAGSTQGGIALWVKAHLETDPAVPSKNPHGFLAENVIVSSLVVDSTSGWNYGVYLDGGENAAPPAGVAPGIRFVRLHNVSVSKAAILAYLFYHAKGTRATMVDCWVPRGSSGVTVQGISSEGTYVVAPSCTLVTP
jgi:hypothetical protein